VDEIPHDWLFPRCAAACHHGGAGTTAASLRSGLPTIIVPFFGDQYFWGRIVSEAGAGPTPVPIGSLTAETLAEAIRFALGPKVRERARDLSRKVKTQQGDEETVASFYRRLPLEAMRCSLDANRVARRACETCALAFCLICDAVVHEDAARAQHRRHPLGHVEWDVSGSPSLLERLERSLADPLGGSEETAPDREPSAKSSPGVVLRDEDPAARLYVRSTPVVVDLATRAKILERFEAARHC